MNGVDYKVGEDVNEYGSPVSHHICCECGDMFTVCPPVPDGVQYGGCLAETCESYDINRDVDALLFFGCTMHQKGR
jgi:uncharacterized RmlC-like cupin family protein